MGFLGADGASGMVDAGRWHMFMFRMPLCHASMHISMGAAIGMGRTTENTPSTKVAMLGLWPSSLWDCSR